MQYSEISCNALTDCQVFAKFPADTSTRLNPRFTPLSRRFAIRQAGLQYARDLHVPDGIASLPGYIKFPEKDSTGKGADQIRALKAKYQALESENLRLHRKIAKLEAQLVSARNGLIAGLENTPPDQLNDEQLGLLSQKGRSRKPASKPATG